MFCFFTASLVFGFGFVDCCCYVCYLSLFFSRYLSFPYLLHPSMHLSSCRLFGAVRFEGREENDVLECLLRLSHLLDEVHELPGASANPFPTSPTRT